MGGAHAWLAEVTDRQNLGHPASHSSTEWRVARQCVSIGDNENNALVKY